MAVTSAVEPAIHALMRSKSWSQTGAEVLIEASCVALGEDPTAENLACRTLLASACVKAGFSAQGPHLAFITSTSDMASAALDCMTTEDFGPSLEAGGARKRGKRARGAGKAAPADSYSRIASDATGLIVTVAGACLEAKGLATSAVVDAAATELARLVRRSPVSVVRASGPAALAFLELAQGQPGLLSSSALEACSLARLWLCSALAKPSSWTPDQLVAEACEAALHLVAFLDDGADVAALPAAGAQTVAAANRASDALRSAATADAIGCRYAFGRSDLASVNPRQLAVHPASTDSAGSLGSVVRAALALLAAATAAMEGADSTGSVEGDATLASASLSAASVLVWGCLADRPRVAALTPWLLRLARQLGAACDAAAAGGHRLVGSGAAAALSRACAALLAATEEAEPLLQPLFEPMRVAARRLSSGNALADAMLPAPASGDMARMLSALRASKPRRTAEKLAKLAGVLPATAAAAAAALQDEADGTADSDKDDSDGEEEEEDEQEAGGIVEQSGPNAGEQAATPAITAATGTSRTAAVAQSAAPEEHDDGNDSDEFPDIV